MVLKESSLRSEVLRLYAGYISTQMRIARMEIRDLVTSKVAP